MLGLLGLMLLCQTKPLVGHEAVSLCPTRCQCDGLLMKCNGVIPSVIPQDVSAVELSQIEPEQLVKNVFCKISWSNVKNLTVAYYDTRFRKFRLEDDIFYCLANLESLKLDFDTLTNFSSNTFSGLDNVISLDLSGCSRICTPALLNVLENNSQLQRLAKLILSGTGIVWCSIEISQSFCDSLATRNITTLDLSNSSVVLKNPDIGRVCHSLSTLILRDTVIGQGSHFDMTQVCNSLQTLDISGAHIPKHPVYKNPINFTNINISLDFYSGIFFSHLSTFYFNRMLSNNYKIYLRNVTLSYIKEIELTELHLCNYNILSFDLELRVPNNRLKSIDLSNNQMASIGGRIFQHFEQLQKVNLSFNKLSETSHFDETFSNLFKRNPLLEEIDLSFNGLEYLPVYIFASNALIKRTFLLGNKFKQLAADMSRLVNLVLMDMRINTVENLDSRSRKSLDNLYASQKLRQNATKGNITVLVDLRGNPFSCACRSLRFLQWFVKSPIFSNTSHMYSCQINGHTFSVTESAVRVSKDDCERPKRRRRVILLSSILPGCGILAVIFSGIMLVKRWKKKLLQKHLEERVRLLHDDETGKKFLVFLSYSSEDDNIVMTEILQPMERCLKTLVDTDRELVCFGDRNFQPGQRIFSEMIRCLDDSAVFIAVMSRNFCHSDYCELEIEQARLQKKPIILIFIEDVNEEEMSRVMRDVFRNFTRVKLVLEEGHYRLQPDWDHVCKSIIQLSDEHK